MKTRFARFFLFLAFCVAWPIVKLYHMTCRIEDLGPLLDYLQKDKPVLLTWWHQDMLFNFSFLVRFARKRKIATIISHSQEGEIAAYLVEKFGIIPIRGSSSRGGQDALQQLVSLMQKESAIGVIVCDGPRPPARVAKFGIIALAWETGLPIIKVRSWGKHQYIFRKSWPKLAFVYPFSRVVMLSDDPLWVPPHISREEQEPYRRQVEEGLNRLAARSERYFV
ncbi:MAG: lysophospholipid acyltransferase family protein [Nitrospiria bacterium]